MIIATSRYSNRARIIESGLVPVRITLGPPRFSLGYTVRHNVTELAPTYAIFKSDSDSAFRALFEKHLEGLDPKGILARLEAIVSSEAILPTDPPPGVVLLCFEDVRTGAECHRTHVAAWLQHHLAVDIQELPDPSQPKAGKPVVGTGRPPLPLADF